MTDFDDTGRITKRPKVQIAGLPGRADDGSRGKNRRKTLEACQKCREKRTKARALAFELRELLIQEHLVQWEMAMRELSEERLRV